MNNIDKLLKRLQERVWYHQRFDGSPMFLSIVGGAEIKKEPRKPHGTEASWRICFYENGKADWFLDQADIDRGAKAVISLTKTSKRVSEDLMLAWKKDEHSYEDYFWKFISNDLSKLSDADLLAEFNRFYTLAHKRFTSSSIIDHFSLGTDSLIATLLRKHIGKNVLESDFSQIFSEATAPVHQSFINEAELSLLKIAFLVQSGIKINSPQVKQKLEAHRDKYFWINNNYIDAKVLTTKDFIQNIKSWIDSGKDLKKEYLSILNTPKNNLRIKNQLFEKYKLDDHLIRLLKISENFTTWQDLRKRATYLAIHIGMQILSEMGKRRNTDPNILKYLLNKDEVSKWFVNGTPCDTDLLDRQKECVVMLSNKLQQVYTGNDVKLIYEVMVPLQNYDDINDIRGLVASTGRAIGNAKILMSANEIKKIKYGDILIAVMTRPDYVPAMRRASAIVTDEGGVTCHAAIVARELGIPCIIGTKIATKVFHDGDKIEVNANHNWVRKVEI